MSFSNALETDILELLFNGTPIANIADNAASSPLTNLYVSLHTADPAEAGNQTTNEATYTGYARVAVARTSSGWTISGDTVSNTALFQFPICTGGSNTITHVAIGYAATSTGTIIARGALTNPITVTNQITPQFEAGVLSFTLN